METKRTKAARKAKESKKRSKKLVGLFFKILICVIECHGLVCISVSYWLAWHGLDPCETISSTVVSEIIAPIVTYGITKTVENVFEKNYFSFSSPTSNVDSYYCSNIKQDNNTMG